MSRVLKYYQTQVDDANKVTVGVPPSKEVYGGAAEQKNSRATAKEDLRTVEEMFERARVGAELILNSATVRAGVILQEAREEAQETTQQITGDARDKGFAEGLKLGEAEGERLRREARDVLEDAHRRREEIVFSVEREVVELISKLVNKLLANTIEIHPGIVAMLVRGQLSNMNATGDVTIRVSPDDYDEVLASRDEIAAAVDTAVNIEIAKDVTFKKAECVLETPLGIVDISLESSYRMLKENLMYLYRIGELHEDH